jgi:ribonuclease HI
VEGDSPPVIAGVGGTSPLAVCSYSAEIMAAIHALLLSPEGASARVVTDCLGVASVAASFHTRSPRRQLNLRFHNLYRVLNFLLRLRPASISWTRSHVGTLGNEIADRVAKDAAAVQPKLTSAAPASAFPIQDLYDLCKLPVALVGHLFSVTRARPGCTPHLSRADGSATSPSGGYAPFLRELFGRRAYSALLLSSSSSAALPEVERCVDVSLWSAALAGKVLHPIQRRLDAHALKLAHCLHTSLASLARTNAAWFAAHRVTPPRRIVLGVGSSPPFGFLDQAGTCPACSAVMSVTDYSDTILDYNSIY